MLGIPNDVRLNCKPAGQISGFLAMKDFLQRFGQRQSDGSYAFSNVRSGLIVGLVGYLFSSVSNRHR